MLRDSLYDSASRADGGTPDVRERLAREGSSALSDAELLAALLGSGTRGKRVRELAEEVVELLDSGRGAPEAALLRRIGGMGSAKACADAAALELGRRLYGPRETKLA